MLQFVKRCFDCFTLSEQEEQMINNNKNNHYHLNTADIQKIREFAKNYIEYVNKNIELINKNKIENTGV